MRERRKELVGRVVSDGMQKTVVVAVSTLRRHRLYQRTMRRTKKYMAHDESDVIQVGDLVRIQESRPISRHKHWRVITVLERAAERGRAVEIPRAGVASGVANVAAVTDTDITPGVLSGSDDGGAPESDDAGAGGTDQ
jgi:small subunit ribosomal protein S17